MGRSQETFHKKEVKKKKEKKRKDKEEKRLARKENKKTGASLEDMMVYIDENGHFTDTPPDPSKKKKIKAENIVLGVPVREKEEAQDPHRKGTVTFFNYDKGFGFIKDAVTKESVFVHINSAYQEIMENHVVSYEVEMGEKGPVAVRVKLA